MICSVIWTYVLLEDMNWAREDASKYKWRERNQLLTWREWVYSNWFELEVSIFRSDPTSDDNESNQSHTLKNYSSHILKVVTT